MAKRITGLGRGLEALLPAEGIKEQLEQLKKPHNQGPLREENAKNLHADGLQELPLSSICVAADQPRKTFDELTISELAQSIFEHGLLQPILVTPLGGQGLNAQYRIVAGERRFRAVQALNWEHIPAIIKAVSEMEHLELALIENIQREDLNPVEEALAYEHLLRISGLSVQEMARRLGKGRSALANSMRLLQLPKIVQEGLAQGTIRSGHAKVLLALKEPATIQAAYGLCVEGAWSVREVERYCKQVQQGELSPLSAPQSPDLPSPSSGQTTQTDDQTGANHTSLDEKPDRQKPLESPLRTVSQNSHSFGVENPTIEEVDKTSEPQNITPINSGAVLESGRAKLAVQSQSKPELRAKPKPPQSKPQYWAVQGVPFREEELQQQLATALRLALRLRLEGTQESESAEHSAPKKAVLELEFANREQWDFWLRQMGLKQAKDSPDSKDSGAALFH